MQIKAAVVRERSGRFVIDTLELCEPRADEVIVRVVASGMCQTDLHGRDGYYRRAHTPRSMGTKAPAWCMPSATPCMISRRATTW